MNKDLRIELTKISKDLYDLRAIVALIANNTVDSRELAKVRQDLSDINKKLLTTQDQELTDTIDLYEHEQKELYILLSNAMEGKVLERREYLAGKYGVLTQDQIKTFIYEYRESVELSG